ncbi:MAG: hypothetical protein F6K19_41330 [Cyanothece sp. SIO1E1]|nr:hypothetical protein [Cyanothece sp. SIO1E1]
MDSNTGVQVEVPEYAGLLDPALLKSARKIYRVYFEVHPEEEKEPLGIAISRINYRGKLIFTGKPVLLPHECFIPFNLLEPELH